MTGDKLPKLWENQENAGISNTGRSLDKLCRLWEPLENSYEMQSFSKVFSKSRTCWNGQQMFGKDGEFEKHWEAKTKDQKHNSFHKSSESFGDFKNFENTCKAQTKYKIDQIWKMQEPSWISMGNGRTYRTD